MKVLAPSRTDAIGLVATTLPARASRLTRLLVRAGSRELTRGETGLLLTLTDGPRRITELADTEALAQPTVTQLVDRLERRALVARSKSPQDGRVVLVTLTAAGSEQLEATREQYRAVMRGTLSELDDDELAELVAATESIGRLVDLVQQRTVRA